MNIRQTTIEDAEAVYKLYQKVAAIPGGLARLGSEITEEYVHDFLEKSICSGVTIVAVDYTGKIVGELHAYCPKLFCFSHVLTDLTVAVDPDFRHQGIATELFSRLFKQINGTLKHIKRVELISRESNVAAIAFYENLGFKKEGKLIGRIKNIDGTIESDIIMGWVKN
jgi:putative acetyltransferase